MTLTQTTALSLSPEGREDWRIGVIEVPPIRQFYQTSSEYVRNLNCSVFGICKAVLRSQTRRFFLLCRSASFAVPFISTVIVIGT